MTHQRFVNDQGGHARALAHGAIEGGVKKPKVFSQPLRALTKYRKNEALIRNDGVYVISGIFCRANACVCGKNAFPPRSLAANL